MKGRSVYSCNWCTGFTQGKAAYMEAHFNKFHLRPLLTD